MPKDNDYKIQKKNVIDMGLGTHFVTVLVRVGRSLPVALELYTDLKQILKGLYST